MKKMRPSLILAGATIVLVAVICTRESQEISGYTRPLRPSDDQLDTTILPVSNAGEAALIRPSPTVNTARARTLDAFLTMDREALRRLIPTIADPDLLTAALYALARYLNPTEEEVSLFKNALAQTQDQRVIGTALWGLGMRKDLMPLDTVLPYLDDPRSEVRRDALRAVGTCKADESVTAVRRLARTDTDPAIRKEAVWFLAFHEGEGSEDSILRAFYREPAQEVRLRWINLLGTLRSPASRDILLRLLRSSQESMTVRREAVDALAFTRDQELLRSLGQDRSLPAAIRGRATTIAVRLSKASKKERKLS